MRLDPAEVPHLPLPAALVDGRGGVVARTPEWRGAPPGSLSYHAGEARLLVSPGLAARPEQEAVMGRLLAELRAAMAAMPEAQALCASVLGSGLELVAGGPAGSHASGTTVDVLERSRAVIRARVPEAEVELVPGVAQVVPAPSQIALALLQFAANASAHEGVSRLRLRVGMGPTFFVEWPAETAAAAVPAAQSHPRLRRRWGLGYVRMVADALGASALPPGPTAPGWTGPCLSLGSRRLTLPLALYSEGGIPPRGRRPGEPGPPATPLSADGTLVRCSQTWQQGIRSLDPAVPGTILAELGPALAAAGARPGAIVRQGLLAARRGPAGTWVAVAPETGPERARDVLHGLDHERPLWAAPEPHATRLHALISLLGRSLGGVPTAYAPEAFARDFPRACAALGVQAPPLGPVLACPDARATAFLLSELGGELVAEPDGTYLTPGPGAAGNPILALLPADPAGRVRLTPGP